MLSALTQNGPGQRAKTLARCAATAVSLLGILLICGAYLAIDPSVAAQTSAERRAEAKAAVRAIDEKRNEARADAEALAREVLSRTHADGEDQRVWANRVLKQAMTRAGEAASAVAEGAAVAPLPAEREVGAVAAGLAGEPGMSQVLIFMSLSVPKPSWRQWAAEAARAGVPLVVRGPSSNGLRATIEEIGDRLGVEEAGVAIDPRLFRLFDITRVPAVVAAPDGVPPCRSQGCADDAPPPFDRITGNIGLAAALAAIAAEGEAGRDAARKHLERLGVQP